jgi:hydroxymethylbilane synthase
LTLPRATDPIRLGTRASLLARTQSATVGDTLAASADRGWVEVLIRTHGDDTTTSLNQPGRPGLFVSALRRALLVGEVDVIVHSFKDLPSAPEPGLVLAAVPPRADPRDALIARDHLTLATLPAGAVVGTSSPRRGAALARIRPDLVVRPIRGNVDSRIAKVRSGEYDATVLAVAGLARIGRADEVAEFLDDLLPAPAQGALAVECREDDEQMRAWLFHLDDPVTRLVTAAEREVLVGVDATCTTAVAAAAVWRAGGLTLRAELTDERGHHVAELFDEVSRHDSLSARRLGLRVAGILAGAAGAPVLLIRSEGNHTDAQSLSALGIAAVSDPYVQIAPRRQGQDGQALIDRLSAGASAEGPAWIVATSPMSVPSWAAVVGEEALEAAVRSGVAAGVRAAATGERTAATLRSLGFPDVVVAASASARGLVDALSAHEPGTAIFPRGNLALRTLPDGLRDLGWTVEEGVVYETTSVAERPASALMIERGEVSAIVLRSPSAVRALVSFVRPPEGIPIVCAGETTAESARTAGLNVDLVAVSPSSPDVADAVARVLSLQG